jgi:hypothetical protein
MPVVVRTSWLPDTLFSQCIRRAQRFVVLLNNQMAEWWPRVLSFRTAARCHARRPAAQPVDAPPNDPAQCFA